jgi:hypothetical protein
MVEQSDPDALNCFKVFQDYFHDTFIKHFKNIPGFKTLIVEESLRPVYNHLLKPLPEAAKVNGVLLLTDKQRLDVKDN